MQTDRPRLGDLNTFNMQHGYMEALVRGYRSGFLSESEYRHLAQCETIDGIPLVQRSLIDMKLNLQETDYGNFMNDEVGSVPAINL